ncbi:glycosyl transferase family 2, partial [mine drainage metagenome]
EAIAVRLLADLAADPETAEIIVVDNASTGRSSACIRVGAASLAVPVEVIENPENRGFAKAVNQGLAQLATDFVLIVNPDCRMPHHTLHRLIEIMQSEPQAGMLGCCIRNPDGSEQRGSRRYLPDPRRSLYRVLGLGRLGLARGEPKGFDLAGAPLPAGPAPVEAISGA